MSYFIRTRAQRQADRDFCNRFMDAETHSTWDGIVVAVAIGGFLYLLAIGAMA